MDAGSYMASGPGIGSGTAGFTNDHPLGFNYDTSRSGLPHPEKILFPGAVLSAGPQQDPWVRAAGDDLVYPRTPGSSGLPDRLYLIWLTGQGT